MATPKVDSGSNIASLWPERYEMIDAWRGLAALAVAVNHVIFHRTGPTGINFGMPSVMLFFVISGYCISSSAESCLRRGVGLREFMARRIRRIYPPYLFSLAFWAATRAVKAHGGGDNELAAPPLRWLQNLTLTQWTSLVGNPQPATFYNKALFVGPYWSLCYEEQFYLLMGLLLFICTRKNAARMRWVVVGLIAVTLAWNVKFPSLCYGIFIEYWAEFAFGALVMYRLCRFGSGLVGRLIDLGLVMVAATSAWLRWGHGMDLGADIAEGQHAPFYHLLIASLFSLLLIGLRPLNSLYQRSWLSGPLGFLGKISFSLYLIHMFNLTAAEKVAAKVLPAASPSWAFVLLESGILVGIASVFWFFCERPFLNKSMLTGSPTEKSGATRIAYLIPKFPGQTHIFFWREMQALREMGVEVDAVSTQPPKGAEVVHSWAAKARETTPYLLPLSLADALRACWTIMTCGPAAWWRCSRAILEADGVGVVGRAKLFANVLLGAKMLSMARARGWDYLHAHSAANAALICMFASLMGGVSYGLTLHGPLEMYGPAQNIKWKYAKFGIAVTERLKKEILDSVRGADAQKIDVAAMGVDLDRFVRGGPYQPLANHERAKVVTCGRLHVGKGHQDLIKAIGILCERGLDVELSLLGEGPAREMLQQVVADLHLGDRVRLHGAVSEESVRDALDKSHVFALGSHDEAIGVATMEGMAMGLPVVVTRVGGVPELVRDGVDGLLVPPSDPNAMADALARVLADPGIASAMGRSGCARVHEKFGSRVSARVIARRLGVAVGSA